MILSSLADSCRSLTDQIKQRFSHDSCYIRLLDLDSRPIPASPLFLQGKLTYAGLCVLAIFYIK